MMDKIRKNTVLSILISLIRYIYPALSFAYAARILHPEGLGQVRYAAAFAGYFVMVTGLGMPIYGMRAASGGKRDDLPALAGELFLIRAVFGLIALGAFLVCLPMARNAEPALLTIFGVNILGAVLECEWLYKGMEEYSALTAISAVSRLLGIGALFLFVRNASHVRCFAWISVLMGLGVNAAEILLAEKKWHLHILANSFRTVTQGRAFAAIRKHLPSLALFFLMSCAVTIYSHTDVVMLGAIKGSFEAGIYDCAAKMKTFLPVITGTLWAAALPQATMLWKRRDTEGFRALADRSYHAVQTVVLPLALYFVIFAGPCVRVLGGPEYRAAALPMRILILTVVAIGCSNIAGGQMLIPAGKEKRLFQAEAVGAVGNIVLNAALIPVLSVTGAAIATAVSETLVAILSIRFVRQFVPIQVFDPGTMKRVGIGCLGASVSAVFLLTKLPDAGVMMLSALCFGLIYGMAMAAQGDRLFLGFVRTGKRAYRRFVPQAVRTAVWKARRLVRACCFKMWAACCGKRFAYVCPCCNTPIRRFQSGGYAKHPETYHPERYRDCDQRVICPVCGALPRHRILSFWCNGHRSELKGNILYFALENGMALWLKRNGIRVTTADLYQPADLKLDIQDTGQAAESYDWVFCNHVLEHIPDYKKALAEIRRLLKPGGHMVCSFPIDESYDSVQENIRADAAERLARFGQVDHLRVFGRDSEEILRSAGFSVTRIAGENMPPSILPVLGPADYDVNYLFLCEKRMKQEE